MQDDFSYSAPDESTNPDEVAIFSWLRWWHWLVLLALFFAGLMYFPFWRFEQRWRQLQAGDSFDRMKQLLGDPGESTYSVQGVGPGATGKAYVYSRYWKSYEVVVSPDSNRVTAKSTFGGNSTQTPIPSSPQ